MNLNSIETLASLIKPTILMHVSPYAIENTTLHVTSNIRDTRSLMFTVKNELAQDLQIRVSPNSKKKKNNKKTQTYLFV